MIITIDTVKSTVNIKGEDAQEITNMGLSLQRDDNLTWHLSLSTESTLKYEGEVD